MARKKQGQPPAFATGGSWHTRYVMLFCDLLESQAFINLSSSAKEAYLILMQEYKGCYTGPRVICPYRTFIEKGMRANTLSRALVMLEVFGFIRIEPGGLARQPSIYHLTGGWKDIVSEEDVRTAKERFQERLNNERK